MRIVTILAPALLSKQTCDSTILTVMKQLKLVTENTVRKNMSVELAQTPYCTSPKMFIEKNYQQAELKHQRSLKALEGVHKAKNEREA